MIEALETRLQLTVDIVINAAAIVDSDNQVQRLFSPGEQIYVRVDFQTEGLPAGASYRIAFQVNGLTQYTGYLPYGAGNAGVASVEIISAPFFVAPGMNQVETTLDPDHSVAEATFTNNAGDLPFSATLNPTGVVSATVAQIRNAYGLNSLANFGSVAADGTGQTIAIVDASDDPNIFTDLDQFDQDMSLTTTTTESLFQQYGSASSLLNIFNQTGLNITGGSFVNGDAAIPAKDPSGGWEGEETLDVEWAHAIAPGAKIDLVEVNFDPANEFTDLLTGVSVAAKLSGVTVVTNSYGLSAFNGDASYDSSLFVTPPNHPGVTFVASSGDNGVGLGGFNSSQGGGNGYLPSGSANVISVGGTQISFSNDDYGSETGWSYPAPATTVSYGSSGYSQQGTWISHTGGFGGTNGVAAAGSAAAAVWTVPITPSTTGYGAGTELSATWVSNASNATNATYYIYDGALGSAHLIAVIPVDQTLAPIGVARGGAQFQELGDFFATLNASGDGTLTVELYASANGNVVAGAVGAAQDLASTGGPNAYESEPSYQKLVQSTGTRTTPDVSFDGSESSGVTIYYGAAGGLAYDAYGTSLSSPCWAGLIAIANQGRVSQGLTSLNSQTDPQQALEAIYSLPASDFHDITTGYNGYSATAGYDFVTGRGTPIANLLIPGLVNFGVPVNLTGSQFYLKLDSDGQHLDIWNSTSDAGAPNASVFLPGLPQITITGTPQGASLTIDFSAGAPLNGSGLLFNGSPGAANILNIVDTGDTSAADFTISTAMLNVTTPIGTVPITFLNTVLINIDAGSGADTITQTAQPGNGGIVFLTGTSSLDSVNVSAGVLVLPAASSGSGVSPVMLGSLSIGAGAMLVVGQNTHADRHVLILNSLRIAGVTGAWQGRLDLEGNDLIVHGGSLATISNQLQSGSSQGKWNGSGILSSSAASDTTHLTAPGIELNNSGSGQPLFGSGTALGPFDGQSPGASDVLIKYTYWGDANLDGKVDGSDYSRIDTGYLSHLTGWAKGDFNYDGVIDGSDYTLIDNVFNRQGASLAILISSPNGSGAASKVTAAFAGGTKPLSAVTKTPKNDEGVFSTSAPIILAPALDEIAEADLLNQHVHDLLGLSNAAKLFNSELPSRLLKNCDWPAAKKPRST